MKLKSIRHSIWGCTAALPIVMAAPAAHAALSAAESFLTGGANYTAASPIIGQGPATTGFSGNWVEAYGGAQSPDVSATGLTYTDGTNSVAVAGGSVEYPGGGDGRAGRLLSTSYGNATSGSIYFAVILQPDSTGDGYRGFEMHNGSLGDGDRKLQIVTGEPGVGSANSNFIVRLFNNSSFGFAGDLGAADTNPNLFVGKFTFSTTADSDSLELWRNPADISSEALSGTPDFVKTGFDLQIDRVALARFNGADGIKADEIRIGTTWSDVTTVINTADSDADGLPDVYELTIINFNPGDAVDGLEDVAGPNNAPTTTDFDGDGSTDAAEFVITTSPTDPDSDDDGLNDGAEATAGTNPLDSDSDNDGLLDGAEINTHSTLPLNADTDGDGENDGTEVFEGTSPTSNTSSSALLGNPLTDGVRDAGYGAPIAVQTIETGFGDNASEWNAAYTKIANGRLYLLFTGNLESNFNKLNIFIDSKSGGSTTFTSSGNDGSGVMNGMTFDADFLPDYHLIGRRGMSQLDLDIALLGTGDFSVHNNVFGGTTAGRGLTGTGAGNTQPIRVAYDGSNTAGIGGNGGAAADQTAAANVTTGFEISISLADLGNPTGAIKVMLLQASGDHSFLSNQTLAGLPETYGNLGTPSTANFQSYPGDQFFTINQSGAYNAWSAANAGNQNGDEDFDGDGVANGVEYFMGETGSTFTANPSVTGGAVSWPRGGSYTGVYGTNYVVQTSSNLSAWTDVLISDPNLDNGSPLEYTLPTGAGPLFVRLKVITP